MPAEPRCRRMPAIATSPVIRSARSIGVTWAPVARANPAAPARKKHKRNALFSVASGLVWPPTVRRIAARWRARRVQTAPARHRPASWTPTERIRALYAIRLTAAGFARPVNLARCNANQRVRPCSVFRTSATTTCYARWNRQSSAIRPKATPTARPLTRSIHANNRLRFRPRQRVTTQLPVRSARSMVISAHSTGSRAVLVGTSCLRWRTRHQAKARMTVSC